MDAAMHRKVSEIWRDVDAEERVFSIIITGDDRTFSVGGDLNHERRATATSCACRQ